MDAEKEEVLMMEIPLQRALISVSDKTGLVPFAQRLVACGCAIYSTGGTRKHLEGAGIEVHDIATYTEFPEMMDGRLKTLHPKVFGGILGRPSHADDAQSMQTHGIQAFELVVVNLYPFEQTIARPEVTDAEAIEQIDIGGPSLVRAAAKNYAFVTIATDPAQYAEIASEMESGQGTKLTTRRRFAAAAFARTAEYDRVIADYFTRMMSATHATSSPEGDQDVFPASWTPSWQRITTLRYGENPHQRAALYRDLSTPPPNLLSSEQLSGKELSYNNYLDLDSAWGIVRGLSLPAVSVIKHNNPCGVACGASIAIAAERAMSGDPVSAFGSILGANRTVDAEMAELLAQPGLFIEAIIAPDFSPAALELFTTKPKWKKNVRLMRLGDVAQAPPQLAFRQIDGGVLIQDSDNQPDEPAHWMVATRSQPSDEQREELIFAWHVARHVKSNAIVLTRDNALIAAGAGQMSRVDSVEIAIHKGGDRARGSVMASDAFFPFADSIYRAAKAGIRAVIQPGGSKNDGDVIAACDEVGISMVLTARRHFRH